MPGPSSAHPVIRVALPGTCGELVQGTWNGVPCLVSCPIDHYSVAEIRLDTQPGWRLQPESPKLQAALHHALTFLDRSQSGGTLRVCSTLPQGRGYGSSTADIGSSLYALGEALGQPLTPLQVATLALQVEPTDSSLFPELTLWDHRGGQWLESLGPPPALTIVILDPGGTVNTIAYNQADHRTALRQLAAQHRDAIQLLREGIQHGDRTAIGAAATLSAKAHQAILPNPLLEPAMRLAREVGAFGICRAHSGTVIGLLLDNDPSKATRVQHQARQQFPGQLQISSRRLIAGGPRLLTSASPTTEAQTKTLAATAQLR